MKSFRLTDSIMRFQMADSKDKKDRDYSAWPCSNNPFKPVKGLYCVNGRWLPYLTDLDWTSSQDDRVLLDIFKAHRIRSDNDIMRLTKDDMIEMKIPVGIRNRLRDSQEECRRYRKQEEARMLPFWVDDDCIESFPCKHFVQLKMGCGPKLMDANEIAQLYIDKKMTVPDHFKNQDLQPVGILSSDDSGLSTGEGVSPSVITLNQPSNEGVVSKK